jgi:hypothetical protein
MLTCLIAKSPFFPYKVLGVPISASKLHVADWAKMEGKPAKKSLIYGKGIPFLLPAEQLS